MSFFSNGFAVMVNNNKLKKAAKSKENKPSERKDEKGSEKKKEKKDEGEWDMLTDAYGRLYWQHNVTGEWSYVYEGGAVVSPINTVAPSPMMYPGGGAVFTPSPPPMAPPSMVYTGGAAVFPPSPVYPVVPVKKKGEGKKKGGGKKKEEEGKKKEEGKGRGWWETMYDEEGVRYWEHNVSKKKTYKDPYV